jgi:hypothetical protein
MSKIGIMREGLKWKAHSPDLWLGSEVPIAIGMERKARPEARGTRPIINNLEFSA